MLLRRIAWCSLFWLGIGAVPGAVADADGITLLTGSPMGSRQYAAHVNGKPIEAYEMVISLHSMNLGGTFQPVDLELQLSVAVDPDSDHVAFCQSAFARVKQDQSGVKPQDPLVPYFQAMVDPNLPGVVTDEGDVLRPAQAINCWEALDPR